LIGRSGKVEWAVHAAALRESIHPDAALTEGDRHLI
jgi:hypothetical protein